MKFWFDLPNRGSLYAKVKSSDYLKIEYDHGLRQYFDELLYIYGGMRTNRFLENPTVHLGVGHITGNTKVDNRVRIEFKNNKPSRYYLDHKTYINWRKFKFGLISQFTLNEGLLNKADLLLGYSVKPRTGVYARMDIPYWRNHNPDWRNPFTYFDTFTADLIHEVDDKTKIGLEVIVSLFSQPSISEPSL